MAVSDISKVDKDKVIQTRNLKISTNQDKTKAYVTIDYFLDDKGNSAPIYKVEEIKSELNKVGIIYGIIEENLLRCSMENKISNLLIAEGENAIEGESDILHVKFQIDNDIMKLHEDSHGRVDFKNIGSVNSVGKDEILAVRVPGKEGAPGKNIFGESIKPKPIKKVKLKAGQGCELKDENTIVALIEGKPCMKNNSFYVYSVHEIVKDVDLSTGNISFLGDIKIGGSVKEGMKVISGNSITVAGNVEGAVIKGKNDITINGNVINSTVIGGGEDSEKLREIEQLGLLHKLLTEMILAIEEIKKFNLLGYDTTDGQIIKLLIDSKFKTLPMACMGVLSQAVKAKQQENNKFEVVVALIKTKLLGLAPISIKHYSEVIKIVELINGIIEESKLQKTIPVNIKLNYCQDSTILSTGDIIFSGKGAYVSSITSQNNIYFIQEKSIVRGGTLRAENEINCKIVGSLGGVVTKLMVSEKGHINISIAHENTTIYIGNKEYVLNYACKDLNAYLNKNNEIVVESLRL